MDAGVWDRALGPDLDPKPRLQANPDARLKLSSRRSLPSSSCPAAAVSAASSRSAAAIVSRRASASATSSSRCCAARMR